MARARCSGSSDLKMPEPTKTPSAPSCIISAASAGVAMPPAEKLTTGRRPFSATQRTSSSGAWWFFAALPSSLSSSTVKAFISPTIVRMWRTASTTLPVPASPFVRMKAAPSAIRRLALRADEGGPLGDPPQRLAQVGRAADERHVEGPLVDVVGLVGRGQDLGL